MESLATDKLEEEISFDAYGRYNSIVLILEQLRKGSKKFKILDVGGRGNLLRFFLPKDEVFYLEPEIESEDKNFIKGSGTQLPLGNDSFDFVVSCDVIEHIKNKERLRFLKENLRVAKKAVILIAPFYNKKVSESEQAVDEYYAILHGGAHNFWLKDHITNGLPNSKQVEEYLKSNDFGFQKFGNNNLFMWNIIMRTLFLEESNFSDKTREIAGRINKIYNTEISPIDYGKDSYRTVYLIKKDKKLGNVKLPEIGVSESQKLKLTDLCLQAIAQISLDNIRIIDLLKKNNENLSKGLVATESELKKIKGSRVWRLRNFLRGKNER